MNDFREYTSGKWPQILSDLANVPPSSLTNEHQPCPACGGTDRFRWDSDEDLGSWFCNQCGGKDHRGGGGNGMDLLMRVLNLPFDRAVKRVEQWAGNPVASLQAVSRSTPKTARKKSGKPARIPDAPPPDAPPPALGKATAQWCYRDAAGDQLFWIQRLDLEGSKKLFVHRTWLDGKWHYPSKKDAFTSEWPAPRPLYRLETLPLMPYAEVLLVEGEKAADRAADLFPQYCVLSWANGSNAIDKVDWSPLEGRSVLLWPDNDKAGEKAMDRIALKLTRLKCSLSVVSAPPGAAEGWDVADAVWTTSEALDHLAGSLKPYAEPSPEEVKQAEEEAQVAQAFSEHFTLLGFRGSSYFYLPKGTGAITEIAGQGHSSMSLCRLAPLAFWQEAYPGPRGGIDWLQATSDLYQQQHEIGEFNPDLLRGRGAWWDRSRSVLHLGDRVVLDGIEQPINVRFPSRYHYQRGISLGRFSGVKPLSEQEAMQVLELAERFYWEVPASALLLSGWCVLAPICGALPWRPHVWLTAGAGTGKTAVLERFVSPLLGEFQLVTQGSTTEAYIRQALRTDALPVVMDEAESNLKSDANRMQNILALARQASAESRAVQGRGSPTGEAQVYRIRSMFLLASIATAVKCGADDRRFAQLTLRRPSGTNAKEEAERWVELKSDLENTLTESFQQRLLARSIGLISQIRESVHVFNQEAAAFFGNQAAGDQYGTLLAGAWHLANDRPASHEDARQMLLSTSWDSFVNNADVLPDESDCLQTILQHIVRVESGSGGALNRTLLELVQLSDLELEPPGELVSQRDARAVLGRHGVSTKEGRIFFGNTAKGLKGILKDTAWSNWAQVLSRIDGAERVGPTHFAGSGTMRAVSVPLETAL